MLFLFCRAYLLLIRTDSYLTRRNFADLYEWVRRTSVRENPRRQRTGKAVCDAVDLAAVWYPKQVLCLQRSAAMVLLLRRCGIAAQMVIGARTMPFEAHAWVEADGGITGEKPYVSEIYSVLDRC